MNDKEKARKTFLQKLKKKWDLLCSQQVDSNIQQDRVPRQTYPQIFVAPNGIVWTTIENKIPLFSDALDYWTTLALLYNPKRSS
jgi:hypothetical protein